MSSVGLDSAGLLRCAPTPGALGKGAPLAWRPPKHHSMTPSRWEVPGPQEPHPFVSFPSTETYPSPSPAPLPPNAFIPQIGFESSAPVAGGEPPSLKVSRSPVRPRAAAAVSPRPRRPAHSPLSGPGCRKRGRGSAGPAGGSGSGTAPAGRGGTGAALAVQGPRAGGGGSAAHPTTGTESRPRRTPGHLHPPPAWGGCGSQDSS